MVFYVYFDPIVITIANINPPYGLQSLVAILRGFLQNCFIIDFEDSRLYNSIKELVDNLPEVFERKEIKTLLATLAKRKRFIFHLVPDYLGQRDDVSCMVEQAADSLIDLVLLSQEITGLPGDIDVASLAIYQNTNFEKFRSKIANEGKVWEAGALGQQEFLDLNFKKAFRFASQIEICDRIFGLKFRDNYKYTLKIMLRWLEQVLLEPGKSKLVFHCGKPEGLTDQYIQSQIVSSKQGRLSNLQIEIQFYEFIDNGACLPHDRFILTDQIALDIGRGMDFLDETTRRNRDTFMGYKNITEVTNFLRNYSSNMLPRISI